MKYLATPLMRLTSSYLLIIMLMSIGFSIVFYNTSAHEIGKHVDLPAAITRTFTDDYNASGRHSEIDAFFGQRAAAVRRALLVRLIIINLLVLVGSSFLSYYLARRTLQPIQKNMEAQIQFVSDASHELRTPLTALQITNEVALRKTKVSSTDAKQIFQQNVEEVMKLRSLTDSLLNLAKNDNRSLATRPTGLSDVVSDALNIVMDSALAKDIIIEDSVPKIEILADKSNLAQAIATILDNAIKYSLSKSTVQISATKRGKDAFLSIHDEGVGIEAVHLSHIFDRFYRVDDSRNKVRSEGFGIGLSLAKKIVEQHNGKITVKSTPAKGSTFTLRIPLS